MAAFTLKTTHRPDYYREDTFFEMSHGGKLQGPVQGGEPGQVQGDSLQAGFSAAQLGPRMPVEAWTDAQTLARDFVACEPLSQEIRVGQAGHGHQSIARKF